MNGEKSIRTPDSLIKPLDMGLSVERLDAGELETVARVLAATYVDYPIHAWAMPKTAGGIVDATMFFTFYLRWMRPYSWDVFGTVDRSAVAVTRLMRRGNSPYPNSVRCLPALFRKNSPVNDFFLWIETFRPKVDHRYVEFFGCLPNAPRGTGFFLLTSVLKMLDQQEHLPVWTWTSNKANLPFFRRLGFEIGTELRRDADTPSVTIIWRPPMPTVASSSVGLRGGQ
jgi:hypothetical protein